MEREKKTVDLMIRRYCRDKHGCRDGLCNECRELLDYARHRLKKCSFQEGKTTCGKCPVHCYKPEMRKKIQEVMRYVGPRMMLTDPWLSFRHFLDGLQKTPKKPEKS